MDDLLNKIKRLKKERNAIILAHNYQIPKVQDAADFIGDSFSLSKKATELDCDVIVFCGVHFMAESVKILNPSKVVLLPVKSAVCPMADMISVHDVEILKQKYPDAAVVCYLNSSARIKAVSDICCTSSNAVKIVQSLPQEIIIFIPDENLGSFIAKQVPEKKIILFKGYCDTHKSISVEEINNSKNKYPDAKLLVHPECTLSVIEKADFVGSTAQIIKYATNSQYKEFIIGTDQGIIHLLQKHCPDKKFYPISPKLICSNMKKTTLKSILNSLETMSYEIKMDDDLINKAYLPLDRMLKVH